MPAPVFVGAGTGVAITTGSATVSKTGCTSGNLILSQIVTRGLTEDWSFPNSVVNIETVAGVGNDMTSVKTFGQVGATSTHALHIGRVMANGTVSADAAVGASSQDMFVRIYEFSGAFQGVTIATVLEGDNVPGWSHNVGTSTTVAVAPVTTLGPDRLVCQFVGLDANLAIGNFTGETGGDYTEAVAEFGSASGSAATLQLQTAEKTSAGTIDGGAITITSAGWGILATAIIPAPYYPPRQDVSLFPKSKLRRVVTTT